MAFLNLAGETFPANDVVGDDEEWIVCNDDGFIYKRMKRPEEDLAGDPPDTEVDPAEEERNRRKRKGKILMKLKRKYQREMDQWDILSNNLRALQEKSNKHQEISCSIESGEQMEKDSCAQQSLLIDELLLMEEAREGMINKVSELCERAQEICRIEEEEKKDVFFNLPVWGSPKDLMASLCYDDDHDDDEI